MRAVQVVACGTLGLALASFLPAAAVPLVVLGLFVGGMWVDRDGDDRASRKAVAHRVGLLVGIGAAVAWWSLGPAEAVGVQRLAVAAGLGFGAGLAGLAACLVGMDARGSRRE